MSGASSASGWVGLAPSTGIGGRSRPRATASTIALPRRCSVASLSPRICRRRSTLAGRRLAISTSAASCSTPETGRSPLRAASSRHSTSSRATARWAGSSELTRGSLPKTMSRSRRSSISSNGAALLAGPVEPPELREAVLQRVGELQQVQHVLAGVAELLLGQRPVVPAGERRRLAQPDAEHLLQQRLVAELRAHPREARRDLRVEHVAQRLPQSRRSSATSWRAACSTISTAGSARTSASGAWSYSSVSGSRTTTSVPPSSVVERDLHQAQQGLVAPLAHELGVDADAARLAGARSDVSGRPRHEPGRYPHSRCRRFAHRSQVGQRARRRWREAGRDRSARPAARASAPRRARPGRPTAPGARGTAAASSPSSSRSPSVTAPWRLASRAPSAPSTSGTWAKAGRGQAEPPREPAAGAASSRAGRRRARPRRCPAPPSSTTTARL